MGCMLFFFTVDNILQLQSSVQYRRVIHTVSEMSYVDLQIITQDAGVACKFFHNFVAKELMLKDLIKSREPKFAGYWLVSCDITFIDISKSGLVILNITKELSRFLFSRRYDLVNVWINSTLCKLIAFIF